MRSQKEYLAWMLYYSLPLLSEVEAPIDLLAHYALFVNSMCTLSKTKITPSERSISGEDLMKFVAHTEINYQLQAIDF